MTDSRVEEALRDQSAMEEVKTNWNTQWRQIAQQVLPRSDYFNRIAIAEGEKRTEHMFDSTAASACERAAAAMESELVPRTLMWHGLSVVDPDRTDDPKWKRWCEAATKVMFKARYAPMANFASQASESFLSLMAFGTQCLFVDELIGRHLRYKSIHISEIGIAENHVGMIDKVHRDFELTVRQAVQKFGLPSLPDRFADMLDKEPERKFKFLHVVKPNDDNDPDARRKALVSQYILCDGRKMVLAGGYRTMPYIVSRNVTGAKEIWGRSPAMTALADIRMLNEMEKTTLRAAHRAVDPPLLLSEDGALQAFSMRPNALNYGGVDSNGRPMAIPLQTGANLPLAFEMSDQKRKSINDIFYLTLFQILVQNPQMTATEALMRAQEKGALLAPTMGRQQSEWLGPMIVRELDILSAAGQLPPPPEPLGEIDLNVEYSSPWIKAQRAGEGLAIVNTLNAILPFAQIEPKVMKRFNFEKIPGRLAEINGMPDDLIYTDDEMAELDDQAATAEAAQAAVAAAPALTQAQLNVAKANSLASAPAPAVTG